MGEGMESEIQDLYLRLGNLRYITVKNVFGITYHTRSRPNCHHSHPCGHTDTPGGHRSDCRT